MRVTKLIREYVSKRVNEAYPKTSAEFRWEEKQAQMSKAMEEGEKLVQAYIEEVCSALNAEYGFEGEYCLKNCGRMSHIGTSYRGECKDPLCIAAKEAGDERRTKIAETIENILVSLELGGTRAELEEMLAKIGKEE